MTPPELLDEYEKPVWPGRWACLTARGNVKYVNIVLDRGGLVTQRGYSLDSVCPPGGRWFPFFIRGLDPEAESLPAAGPPTGWNRGDI